MQAGGTATDTFLPCRLNQLGLGGIENTLAFVACCSATCSCPSQVQHKVSSCNARCKREYCICAYLCETSLCAFRFDTPGTVAQSRSVRLPEVLWLARCCVKRQSTPLLAGLALITQLGSRCEDTVCVWVVLQTYGLGFANGLCQWQVLCCLYQSFRASQPEGSHGL